MLGMVGSVPGRLRMGPHSQSSWLGVSWWEFSPPRGAKRGGGRGSFSGVLLEGGPGEPRDLVKAESPAGGGEVEGHEGPGVRIPFFPLKSMWWRMARVSSPAGDGSHGTRGLFGAAAADLGGLHGLVEGREGQ